LIFCFFNSAGLFVLLGAEFIAMLMVIVYVGAVAVLFLFVVMMLNVDFARLKAGFMRYLPLGIAIAVVMFAELLLVIRQGLSAQTMRVSPEFPITEGVTNTEALGRILYTDYVLIFQVSGLILLVAMVGAIVLTLRVRDGVRKQNISEQLSRKREDCVEVVSVETGKGV
jgi:NADH-quinone oxidoreductase subunit J